MVRFVTDSLVVDRSSQAPLQAFAVGLPRTATSSLQAAFESPYINCGPCMHIDRVAPHADRGDLLLAAVREQDTSRRQKLLRKVYAGFQAAADFPGCMLINDLMDMYPEARIVLNTRPGGSRRWVQSVQQLVWVGSRRYGLLGLLWKTDRNLRAVWLSYLQLSGERLGLRNDELLTEKHYEAHNAWIRAQAAQRGRQVLEFDPSDGWAPLCAFFGCEPPVDEPFPHRNDAAEIRTLRRYLYARGILSWLGLLALLLILRSVVLALI
jgi:Sulfotransferase domain